MKILRWLIGITVIALWFIPAQAGGEYNSPLAPDDQIYRIVISRDVHSEPPKIVVAPSRYELSRPIVTTPHKTTPISTKQQIENVARTLMPPSQVVPFLEIAEAENNSLNPAAQNPNSTAFGLFQMIDSNRIKYGCNDSTNITLQVKCGYDYIVARYGTPALALQWHLIHNSY